MELALPKSAMFVLFVLSFGVCCRLMDSLCPLHVQCACLTDDHLMEKSPLCGLPQVIVRHTMQQQLLPILTLTILTMTCTGDMGTLPAVGGLSVPGGGGWEDWCSTPAMNVAMPTRAISAPADTGTTIEGI